MAAGHDGRQAVIEARTTREDVSHGVDADGAPRCPAPIYEQIARRLVHVGEGEATDAAIRRHTDLAHVHQASPEPLAIDRQISRRLLSRGHSGSRFSAWHRQWGPPPPSVNIERSGSNTSMP